MTQKREFSREFWSPSPSSLSLSLSAQPLLPNKVSEKQQHHNCITTHGFTADLFLLLAIVSRFYFKAQTWARDANLCPMIVQAATNLLLGDSKRRYFLCFSCNFGNSCENFTILSELLLRAWTVFRPQWLEKQQWKHQEHHWCGDHPHRRSRQAWTKTLVVSLLSSASSSSSRAFSTQRIIFASFSSVIVVKKFWFFFLLWDHKFSLSSYYHQENSLGRPPNFSTLFEHVFVFSPENKVQFSRSNGCLLPRKKTFSTLGICKDSTKEDILTHGNDRKGSRDFAKNFSWVKNLVLLMFRLMNQLIL